MDCVDGEVARYTRTFSPLGGWLDIGSDRIKEYAVYAGLAVGVPGRRRGALASRSLRLLVIRHFVDFGYAASAFPGGAGAAGPVAAWSARTVVAPGARCGPSGR